jgi:hypothetical protein
MSYTHEEEVEGKMVDQEVVGTLSTEVSCTYAGAPESGPTYSSGGEPAEPAEFECDGLWLQLDNGEAISLSINQGEALFGVDFMTAFYERAEEKAAENYDPGDDMPDPADSFDDSD